MQEIKTWWWSPSSTKGLDWELVQLIERGYTIEQVIPTSFRSTTIVGDKATTAASAIIVVSKGIVPTK